MSDDLVQSLNDLRPGYLPGLIGLEIVAASPEGMRSRLEVRRELMAPNGFLHAASVVALADTTCGFGTRLLLPEGSSGFTTIELKTNFLGTVREGAVACEARAVHAGRTTQVWDAVVRVETPAEGPEGKLLALFRCTQAVLWPR
ncbi:MAG TPA: PaaI family thioesterase [Mycobacteriales bacterium]|nr:PaaI family thioesterase [Mycobacteriales bacterium]